MGSLGFQIAVRQRFEHLAAKRDWKLGSLTLPGSVSRVLHLLGRLRGGGTAAEIGLEAVFGELSFVLRFEARVFGGQFVVLTDV